MDPSDFSFFIIVEHQLDFEHLHRAAVASFEVDGPDPKDAAEIEILRASLARDEAEGDLRRHMVRLLVDDAGHDTMWKDKMLGWVMRGRHQEGGNTGGMPRKSPTSALFRRLPGEHPEQVTERLLALGSVAK
jgi:hypothetical protein